MKKSIISSIKWAAMIVVVFLGFFRALPTMAIGTGLTLSPMYQKIIVNPGEEQKVSFRLANPSAAVQNVYYELSVEPFYMNENGELVYQAEDKMGDIVNWVKFDVPIKGKIEPNGVEEIAFSIDVPESAPAGGQYFAVMVTEIENDDEAKNESGSEDNKKTAIKETFRMVHLVYAEVTGSVIRQGEITDVNLPSFFLSGNITGSALVKNTGNVHGEAIYTMQVFPLFSSEEVYTNEENPETSLVLPNRSSYHSTSWDKTPEIGIFNVVYTVTFGDSSAQVKKMVIKCPLWLLFIIVFIIVAIIMWLIMKAKARNKR